MDGFVLASLAPVPRVWNFYETQEAAAAAAPAINAREGITYEPMTFDAFKAARRAHYVTGQLETITQEKWWEMLDVLPPMRWEVKDGCERFMLGEMLSGTITSQYARIGDRCVSRNVDAADPSTWITGAEIERHFANQTAA